MEQLSVGRPKRGVSPKLLRVVVSALMAASIFIYTYVHVIYLPSISHEPFAGHFLRSVPGRAFMPVATTKATGDLREFFRKRAATLNADQELVVNMTRHAWKGYRDFAEWKDYLDVEKMAGGTVYRHDMALTAVDSLDTLFLMGLHDEFDEASAWVKENLENVMFQKGTVSFFEVTIRSLGGLLSAYFLSGEKHLLDLSASLGKALKLGFTCGVYVPCRLIDLKKQFSTRMPFLSEASTFQMEFAYLAQVTQDDSFLVPVNLMNSLMIEIVRTHYPDGMVPVSLDWTRLEGFRLPSTISMGALGDSYYEYLLKQWLLSGKQDDRLKDMYLTVVDGLKSRLIGHSYPSNYTFIGSISRGGKFEAAMEHLTCFVPGMLALGYAHGMPEFHLELAKELTDTCVQMYLQSETKLAPEITHFDTWPEDEGVGGERQELSVLSSDDYNLLRPETIESLFVLYRVTGDEIYREHGRIIMNAFETHSKLAAGGYRSTEGVWAAGDVVKTRNGCMESFFVAETLKYLYLLFSDADVLPLDEVVLNTEAHPFPVFHP